VKNHIFYNSFKKHKVITMQLISSNSVITSISCTKFVGVNIDGSFSWKDHITELLSRVNIDFVIFDLLVRLSSLLFSIC
jgi:hypothetical protein